MFASIGYGAVTINQVLYKLIDFFRKEVPQPLVTASEPAYHGRLAKGTVTINGQTGLLVSFAGCCSPVPGDEIVGFVTRGAASSCTARTAPT